MKAHVHEHRDARLALGLLVGTVIGAGVVWWFAPRLSGLRQRLEEATMADSIRMGEVADAVARAADDGAPEPAASITR
jgi:hypothetical protein